jgi:carbon-monoxide dehydrogenase small subunit
MKKNVTLQVNGRMYPLEIDVKDLLLQTIREQIGLTGTKEGCGTGECGACTVLIDGEPVNACLYFTVRAEGKDILTIEGMRNGAMLHPLQEAFATTAALQCGFCGPGVLLSAKALLDRHPNPTEQQIREGIAGNICRCTGYTKMVEAIQTAAVMLREDEVRS